jgi:hypothetical protein
VSDDGIDQLPDDPVLLKQLIVRIRAEAAEQLEAPAPSPGGREAGGD